LRGGGRWKISPGESKKRHRQSARKKSKKNSNSRERKDGEYTNPVYTSAKGVSKATNNGAKGKRQRSEGKK